MKLIFVYNAKSNPINKILDAAHKIVKPLTYSCDLCNLTHHGFGEREVWKKFREKIKTDFEFLYLDQFVERFQEEHSSFPVILKYENNELITVLSRAELTEIESLESLIHKIEVYIRTNQ